MRPSGKSRLRGLSLRCGDAEAAGSPWLLDRQAVGLDELNRRGDAACRAVPARLSRPRNTG